MIKLYHHKTGGGAEYLCTKCLLETKGEEWLKSVTREGFDWRKSKNEGDMHYAVIRLDGVPELYENKLRTSGIEIYKMFAMDIVSDDYDRIAWDKDVSLSNKELEDLADKLVNHEDAWEELYQYSDELMQNAIDKKMETAK